MDLSAIGASDSNLAARLPATELDGGQTISDSVEGESKTDSATDGASAFERAAIKVVGSIPGLNDVAASPRFLTVLHGTTWTMVGYGVGQVLRLASTLLLARLLVPEAFGLVALVNVFLGGLEMLTDLGIGLDVVQHKSGDDPLFINTAFLVQCVRGILIWIIATLLAFPFAHFYHQPAIIALAAVASLSVLFRGFAGGSVWLLLRHVQIGKLTTLNVSSDFIGFVVSVIWALISPTMWALVAGRIATALAFMIGSHLIPGHVASLKWDRTAGRDILMFGTGIFLSSATYFLSGQAERLVVAKFVTVAALGCFSLALSLSGAALGVVTQVSGQVFFPMISKALREDRQRAAKHYRKTRFVFTALSIIVGIGFVAYSHRLVAFLLPPKYEMTGWMLQLLGWRAAQVIFASPAVNLTLACSDSRAAAVSNTVRLVAMLAGLWVAFTHFGLYAAIAVLALSATAGYLVYVGVVARHLRSVIWAEIGGFALFVAATAVAVFIPWPWR